MRHAVGFFDSLFGKKVEVILPQDAGPPERHTVTMQWLNRMAADRKMQRADPSTVFVHMLGLAGYEIEFWRIGAELDQESYDQFYDPETAAVYAMRHFKAGEPVTHLLAKPQWFAMKKQLDAVG